MVTAGVRRLWVVVMDNEAVVFGFYLPAVLHPLYYILPPSFASSVLHCPFRAPHSLLAQTQSNLIYDDTVAIPLPKLYSSVPLGAQERHSIWKMRGGVPLTGTPLALRNIELMPPLIHVHAALSSTIMQALQPSTHI